MRLLTINKYEDSNVSDDSFQEIRSEEGKQDQNRLDDSALSKRKWVEEQKTNYNLDKNNKLQRNKPLHNQCKKNKKNKCQDSVKLEEVKTKQSYKGKDIESDPDDNSSSPINKEGLIKKNINQDQYLIDCFDQNCNQPFSLNSEAKSTKSEDKNNRRQVKYINSTNPTSETSSIKDCSVVSNQDNKWFNSDSKKNKDGNSKHNNSKHAPKQSYTHRGQNSKNAKYLKTDRAKYL